MVELIESAVGALTVNYADVITFKWTGEHTKLNIRFENTGANPLDYRVFGAMDSAYTYRTELTEAQIAAGANATYQITNAWPYIQIQERGVGGVTNHATHAAGG